MTDLEMFSLNRKVQLVNSQFFEGQDFNFDYQPEPKYRDFTDKFDFDYFSGDRLQPFNKIIDPDDFFEKYDNVQKSNPALEGTTEATSEVFSPSHYENISGQKDHDSLSEDQTSKFDNDIDQPYINLTGLALKVNRALSIDNKNLIDVVIKILEGAVTCQSDLQKFELSDLEYGILEAILEKKRLTKIGKKREEEKQKIFYKGLLKNAEKKFFDKILAVKKYAKKKISDKIAFYEYYWGSFASQHNIDLSNFFHPNKKIGSGNKGKKNPNFKSLNFSYISLILSSEPFKNEMINYINYEFVQQHIESRIKKIFKLQNKLLELANKTLESHQNLSEELQEQKIVSTIKHYILTNSKAKLPWSNEELKETKEFGVTSLTKQVPLTKILEHIR